MDSRRRRNDENPDDVPIYSRLFLVCERKLTENDLKEAFSPFGNIEDVRIPRDHNTGEPKGVAYVKYSKTSEAAAALEQMNGKLIGNSSRPLKVMVATNRSEIQSDDRDFDKFRRLFIYVSKETTEDMLQDHFETYGYIESIQIQRDRNTGESKGFAYIKFRKFSEAAFAYEECDKKYRAVFAQPKSVKRPETAFESNISNLAMTSANMRNSLVTMMNCQPGNFNKVAFMCCPQLTQYHVENLFDIVPGMVECRFFVDLIRGFGKGVVTYSNAVAASYAVQKLNRFEYPPGMKVFVKPDNSTFDSHEQNFNNIPKVVKNLKGAIAATNSSSAPDLAQLAEAIAEASKIIKLATAGPDDSLIPASNDLNYCSVKLPPTQPLADIDAPVAKRCFLVCKPQPPPLTVLRDIFCRFGNLINVYTLTNKTVGYARYAVAESADKAIKTLHGAEICGVRMKVLEADESGKPEHDDDGASKRRRFN